MIDRFAGDPGRRLRLEAICNQKLVAGNRDLAERLTDLVQLRAVKAGDRLITQDEADNDVFLILAGSFEVVVNSHVVQQRFATDHVGEMSAIEPAQPRSATVVARENAIVATVSEAQFAELGAQYPEIYRCIARELAKRLRQRNALIGTPRERPRVFIISSAEALDVARIIQTSMEYDHCVVTVWTDGVFRISRYAVENLEREVDSSDFAIAIAHGDDKVESRGEEWPAPRDNVIFELGLFMGRLGRDRAVLMEPRGEGVKLPSDLKGITTIPYRYEPASPDVIALMAPACNKLRHHIRALGPIT